MDYSPKKIEPYWQDFWSKEKSFSSEKSDKNLPKKYILEMFPYPSGRIHMGHVRNYTIGDVITRYRITKGDNVLHPMGWDAFGMPAENAAMENKIHPKEWTYKNIDSMREQLKSLGLAIDWGREFATCDHDYIKHQQTIFIDFLKNDLVYRKESEVNWDPVDNTVLANEQVIDGLGWRSGAEVERRKLNQWFLKISDFSDDLLNGLEELDKWPEKVKLMQKNWIGKSSGAVFSFKVIDKSIDGNMSIPIQYSTIIKNFGHRREGSYENLQFLQGKFNTDESSQYGLGILFNTDGISFSEYWLDNNKPNATWAGENKNCVDENGQTIDCFDLVRQIDDIVGGNVGTYVNFNLDGNDGTAPTTLAFGMF